jgi:phosphoglycolate phosphatase-like HAD superfamily hydrolase
MLLRAARELGLDLKRSWLIGDILDDMAAGNRAGCRTILLDVGHETEWRWSPERRPTAVAADLTEAARLILAADTNSPSHAAPRSVVLEHKLAPEAAV